jgi:nucleotide-binding universal stress UspA family protein
MLPPKLILSPIDFSDHSDEALKAAADLARTFQAELLLVHVVPALPKLPPSVSFFQEGAYETALTKDAQDKLQELVHKFEQSGLHARLEVGVANDVGMEILRIAQHSGADLIVIATHGMSGWHRLAFGSVAEKVVRMAAGPVLVLRAHAEEETGDASQKAHSASVAG